MSLALPMLPAVPGYDMLAALEGEEEPPQAATVKTADECALDHLVESVLLHCNDQWIGATHAKLRTIVQHYFLGVVDAAKLHRDIPDPATPLSSRGYHMVPYASKTQPDRVTMWAADPIRANPIETTPDVVHGIAGCVVRYVAEQILHLQWQRHHSKLPQCCFNVQRYLNVPDAFVLARSGDFTPPTPSDYEPSPTRLAKPGDLRVVTFMPRLWPITAVNDTLTLGFTPEKYEAYTDQLLFTLLQSMTFLVEYCGMVPRVFTLDNIMLKLMDDGKYRVVISGHGYTVPAHSIPPRGGHRVANYLAPEDLVQAVKAKTDRYHVWQPVDEAIASYMLGNTWLAFLTGEHRVPNEQMSEEDVLEHLDAYYSQPKPEKETAAARICRLLSVRDPAKRMPLRQALFELKPVNGIPQRTRTQQWYVVTVLAHRASHWHKQVGDPRRHSLYRLLLTSQHTIEVGSHTVLWHYMVDSLVEGGNNVPTCPPTSDMWDELIQLLRGVRYEFFCQNVYTKEVVHSKYYLPATRQIMEQFDPVDMPPPASSP
jgi:hypothetical protein